MKRYNQIMEVFWLLMGIALIGFSVYNYFEFGVDDFWVFFLVGSMAIMLSLWRRFYRKKDD